MHLHTYAKIGIVVGIACLVILTPLIALSFYLQAEHEFSRLFVDTKKQLQLMKEKESFKNFLERYPDAIVEERDRRHNVEINVRAFSDITGNVLHLGLGYDYYDDRIYEHAGCDIHDREIRQQLGPMPDIEIKIPATLFKEGNAHEQFTAEFVKYTNCIEIGKTLDASQTVTEELPKTSHYVAIPQDTSMPGCEETDECFNPYSVTINAGQVIEWQNFDEAAHTVTSGTPEDGPDGYFDSGLFMEHDSFKVHLKEAGTFDYFCLVHPWQTGKIIVLDVEPENEN